MRIQFLRLLFGVSMLLASFAVHAQEKSTPSEPVEGPEEGKAVFTPPELVEAAEAVYPPKALAAGLEAVVEAELELDETGLVVGVAIKERVGNGFDEAAEDALYKFVFSPAMRNGAPIRSKVIYPYRFFIQEQAPQAEAGAETAAPACSLVGTVLDMDGKPIAGASVVVVSLSAGTMTDEKKGQAPADGTSAITTDSQGKFELRDISPGSYQIDFLAPGFKPLSSAEDMEDGEIREVTYRLEAEDSLYETVVRGRRPAREVTRREVTRREITRIPGTGGDALRSVQYMPGMARAPFGGGALIVRGSSPADSAYYFDSTRIPMLYHFGGLTSIINSELLESIELYPGNFSVRYGGATGGVVEVFPRAPASDRFHAYLDADFIDAGVMVETPIGDKWSVAASGRRSYIGNLLNALMPDNEGAAFTFAPRYYDYQLITDYHPSKKNNWRLFIFGSDDKMELIQGKDVGPSPTVSGDFNFRILFHQLQSNWTHNFNKALSNSLNIGTAYVRSDSNFGTLFDVDFHNVPIYLRDELAFDEKRNLAFRIGLDTRLDWYKSQVRAPVSTRMVEGEPMDPLTGNEEMAESERKGFGAVPGFYGEVELRPIPKLALIGGARFDYFDDAPTPTLDPRLVVRYKLFEPTTLKGGIGIFHQPPQGFQQDEDFGNPDLGLLTAVHYSLGVEQEIIDNVEVGLEGFYKNMTGMVVSSPDPVERFNNDGEGKVWGMELLLKHYPTERFFGWISYTLMKSERIDHPGLDPRPFDSDQTHILTIVASARLGRGWEMGLTFRLVSGNPDTPVVGSYFDADSDIYMPLYGDVNSDRLPMFHQLDFRVDKNWKWKYLKAAVYLDIQNIYNHKNPETYQYNYDYSERQYFYGLPIIPSLGLMLEY